TWVHLGLLLLLLAAPVPSAAGRPQKCSLPRDWHGQWFHSGFHHPITINETSINFKGVCLDSDRDRFLIRDTTHGCYRCVVIHQKHHNVIQYKETYCDRKSSLDYVCSLLTGDAQLHSMFRKDAKPVSCPFPHTYTFTYNRGHGECHYPKSTVDSCTEDWRMLMRYQACPDVMGTESSTEELLCLATWKDGSNRFLVGKSNHPLANSEEDKYRCYLYEAWNNHNSSGFHVAQSGDATCNGLFSVKDGSRTLKLTKVDTSGSQCRFPVWVGGPHWHSLDGRTSLHVTKHNSTLRLTGHSMQGPATHACLMPFASTQNSATYVTRVIHGCTSGYQCVHMLARDEHVLEFIMGRVAPMPEEACSSDHFFNISSTEFITFISGSAESRDCPGMGRYQVKPDVFRSTYDSRENNREINLITTDINSNNELIVGSSRSNGGSMEGMSLGQADACEADYTSLTVGCDTTDTLKIETTCSHSVYSCHGWWEEAGRQYLVVTPRSRSSKGPHRLCLVLNRTKGGHMALASSVHSCSRDLQPGRHGTFALNTTNMGGCHEAQPISDAAHRSTTSSSLQILLPLLLLLVTISRDVFTVATSR
ncbi:unnamed protein product, partial [Meganyctiphanes norvegica]